MAIQRAKIALNNANFPLTSAKAQRSIFIPAIDVAQRTPRSFVGEDGNIDYNVPQIIYGENFMPQREGVASVGYQQLVVPTVNSDFDSIFTLRDADENTVLYSPAAGKNYVYDESAGAWAFELHSSIWAPTVLDPAINLANQRVTYAYVDGKTFVCYARCKSTGGTPTDMSIMFWDSATSSLTPAGALIANLPFAAGEIDGISSSSGYLLVWSGLSVAWAPFNGTAFDFTIYANGAFTGAGVQIPEDIKAPITALIPMSGGFAIFTLRNAIGASYYAQSLTSPWLFREIPNAGGMDSYEQATVQSNLGKLIAYTSAGLQELSINSAQTIHPDVSDFIAGRTTERYDFGTHSLVPGGTSLDFFTKIAAVGNRFIVVSYGYYPGTYSYCLVFDNALRRWGKLRIVHRDCFAYTQSLTEGAITYSMTQDVSYAGTTPDTYADMIQSGEGITAAQHALAFLMPTGEIKLADWSGSTRTTQDEAIVLIGRIQLSRGKHMQFNRIEAEGMKSGSIWMHPSYDGRNTQAPEMLTVVEQVGDYMCAGGLYDCKNFSIAIEGTFNLSTLVLEGTTTGSI